jgi:formylglycine-generating enzyme required for sulfatase activity
MDVTAEYSDQNQTLPGPTPPPALRLGSMIGKYRISAILGTGGMGSVYAAKDPLIKRDVAIKILPPELVRDRPTLDRFLGEARAAGALNHPNVVTIYEVVEIEDGAYAIVMERVTGGSVQSYLTRKGPPGWRAATRLIGEACKALIAAHELGLIHRDIKPANLLLTGDGHIKVADFGLAKVEDPNAAARTQPGAIIGTPAYMSPEQCRGDKIDARSDLYSLGCTYYAMLTNRPPFEAASGMQVMFAHCSAPIPDPRTLAGDVPDGCVAILNKSLAKTPAERYTSARDFLADVRAVLGGSTTAAPHPVSELGTLEGIMPLPGGEEIAPPTAAPRAGFPAWATWAIAGGVAAIVALSVTIWLSSRPVPYKQQASIPPSDSPSTPDATPTGVSPPPAAAPATAPSTPAPPGAAAVGPPSAAAPSAQALPTQAPPAHSPVSTPPIAPAVMPVPPPTLPSAAIAPTSPPWRNDAALEKSITNSINVQLHLIPAGTFTMGDALFPDAPKHQVTLTQSFYIGVYEISQGEFRSVMGEAASERTRRPELPAAGISWEEANEFCRHLSELPAEKRAGRVYRLPTEAEWEYADRAGTTTRYPSGNTLKTGDANFGKKLNNALARPGRNDPADQPPGQPPGQGQPNAGPPDGNPDAGPPGGPPPPGGPAPGQPPAGQRSPPAALRRTRPLEPRGGYPANPWGLFDMQGSVWEWCSDFYSPGFDLTKSLIDPTGAPAGPTHVARGGCWNSPAEQCASAYRNGKTDKTPNLPVYGFRVVCQIRSEPQPQ